MKKKLKFLLLVLLGYLIISLSSCKSKIESGELMHISFSSNYAVGTDSAIFIIDRETGKTLNIIKR